MELDYDIKDTLAKYFNDNNNQTNRERSFDYCYNYFKIHDSDFIIENMELSCLSLGYYLASWGMLRGSSFLLQKSTKYFVETIEFIAKSKVDKNLWAIDVDNYSVENINKIINIYNNIKEIIIKDKQTHLTLVSKILLGVYGFIPAFDTNFIAGFKSLYSNGFTVINQKSLNLISDFYQEHHKIIDLLAKKSHTIDFQSGKNTDFNYPKAKIIDMYGFELGMKILEKTKYD